MGATVGSPFVGAAGGGACRGELRSDVCRVVDEALDVDAKAGVLGGVRVMPDAAEGVPDRRVDTIPCHTGRGDGDRDEDLVVGHRGLAGRDRADLQR